MAEKFAEAQIAGKVTTPARTFDKEYSNTKFRDEELATAEPIGVSKYMKKPGIVQSGGYKQSSNVDLGDSKYDEGVPLAALPKLDEHRAMQQSFGDALLNGFVSRATSIVPKVVGGLGYVLGAVPALIAGDASVMTDNPMSMAMEELDEGLREALPVYASSDYNSQSILDVLSSQKFWFDDLFDGLAFAASAYVPGGAISKAGKAIGLLSKGAKGVAATQRLAQVATGLQKANPFLMTAYNTVSEAGFESRDTQKQVEERHIEDGMDPIEAKKLGAAAAANTFKANAAVLLFPNFIQSKFMLGGLKSHVSGINRLVQANAGNISKVTKSVGRQMGKDILLGIVSEGLWEEGMQTAIQKYEGRMGGKNPVGEDTIGKYMEEWAAGWSDVEAQKSMILGAIIGGGMGAYGGLSSSKAYNKQIVEKAANWEKYTAKDLKKFDTTFAERFQKIDTEETTTDDSTKAFYRTIADQDLFTEATASALKGDVMHDRYNKKMAAARYAWGFLNDTENFDDVDHAAEFAIERLDHVFTAEESDPAEVAKLKEDIQATKEAFVTVAKKVQPMRLAAKTNNERSFINAVQKSLVYEELKRQTLEESKAELDEKQIDAVDNLIADSKDKTKRLLSRNQRNKVLTEWVKIHDDVAQIDQISTDIETLQEEISETISPTVKPVKDEVPKEEGPVEELLTAQKKGAKATTTEAVTESKSIEREKEIYDNLSKEDKEVIDLLKSKKVEPAKVYKRAQSLAGNKAESLRIREKHEAEDVLEDENSSVEDRIIARARIELEKPATLRDINDPEGGNLRLEPKFKKIREEEQAKAKEKTKDGKTTTTETRKEDEEVPPKEKKEPTPAPPPKERVLTAEDKQSIKEKENKIKELEYKKREFIAINGVKKIDDLDIAYSEQQREKWGLGLVDKTNYEIGMSFQKRRARNSAFDAYKAGTATAEEVYGAIVNNTDERSAPLSVTDKEVLERLQSDLRDSVAEVDPNDIAVTMDDVQSLEEGLPENREQDINTWFGSEENYQKKLKELDAYKKSASLLPRIQNTLDNNKFQDKEANLANRKIEEKLQAEAMEGIIHDVTDPVLASYESNPESFSDVNAVEMALDNLDTIEYAKGLPERNLMNMLPQAKILQKEIETRRKKLEAALDKSIENRNNKTAADLNAKKDYGKTRAKFLDNSDTVALIDKHLNGAATKTIQDLEEDDYNFIHVEKLIADIKAMPKDRQDLIMKVLGDQKELMIQALQKEVTAAYARAANAQVETLEPGRQANAKKLVDNKIEKGIPDLFDNYRKNPSSQFSRVLRGAFMMNLLDTVTRPINIFDKNVNISELAGLLTFANESDNSGLKYANTAELKSVVELQVAIESIESFTQSMETTMDTVSALKGELSDFQANKTAGIHIAPSRQQRIALFELLRWFKTANRGAGRGAMAYLKGIAGTGKTTVVARILMKLAGVQAERVLAIANNESSTGTLNESLSLTGKKTIHDVAKEDIEEVDLVFVDEVGAMGNKEFNAFSKLVTLENVRRSKIEGSKELKVVVIGDPTQIRGKMTAVVPIDAIDPIIAPDGALVEHITPLTIPFRSDISSILEVQDAYHMNLNEVKGLAVTATARMGLEAKGVHAGTTMEHLTNQVLAHKDNGKTKVIVVEDEAAVAKYLKVFKTSIPKLEILTYFQVQGRTFQEVFVDISPSVAAVRPEAGQLERLVANRERNSIMYTATSRAQEYLFILDHTGMKNNTSESITASEEKNKKEAKKYRAQYPGMVNKDIRIMQGKTFTETDDIEISDEDEDIDTIIEEEQSQEDEYTDEVIIDTGEESIGDEVTPELDEEEVEIVFGKLNNPSEPGIHNVKHSKNLAKTVDNTVKMRYDEGDEVVYVKVDLGKGKDPDNVGIKMYVRNKDAADEKYQEVGILSDEESYAVFGMSVTDLSATKEGVSQLPTGGVFLNGLSEDVIVARGVINGTPQPLTYTFKKARSKVANVFNNIAEKMASVFAPAGFTVDNIEMKVFTPNQVKNLKKKRGGIKAGVPYLIFEMKSSAGTEKLQYIKLSPRKLSRANGSEIFTSIDTWTTAVEEIETILAPLGEEAQLGNEDFNKLIRKFKTFYTINEKGDKIIKAKSGRFTFTEAKTIFPKMTADQFKEVAAAIDPIIKGVYGIDLKNVKWSIDEWNEFINRKDVTKAPDRIEGEIYYEIKGEETNYRYNDESGLVQTVVWSDKHSVYAPATNQRGHQSKYMKEYSLEYGSGPAQTAINRLAKNNKEPGGIRIRTIRNVPQPDGTMFKNVSGKSLVTSYHSNKQYMQQIRSIMETLIGEEDMIRVNLADKEDLQTIENILIDTGAVTRETLDALRDEKSTNLLTTANLRTLLETDETTGESKHLYRPLDIKRDNLEELGKEPIKNHKELQKIVESHFDQVLPTTVQIKIVEESKPEVKPKTTKKDGRYAKRKKRQQRRDDIKSRLWETEEGKSEGRRLTQTEVRDMINEKLPGLTPKQIQFVDDLSEYSFASAKAMGAWANDVIYLQLGEDGTVGDRVVRHEVFHVVYTRMNPNERRRMKEAFSEEFTITNTYSTERQWEELMADTYMDWKRGDFMPKNDVIIEFFRLLRDFFRFVGVNKYYIEGVFRDIDAGRYNKHGSNSLRGASRSLRKAFPTTGALKESMAAISSFSEDLFTNGKDGYPIAKTELKDMTKIRLVDELKEFQEEVLEAVTEYESLLDKPATQENIDRKLELEEDIRELQEEGNVTAMTIKHFDEVWYYTFPAWTVKSTLNADEILSEQEIELGLTEVSSIEDILDWDKVNMEGRVSSIAKQFLSNIRDHNGKVLPLRAAYAIALDLTSDIMEVEASVGSQIRNKIDQDVGSADMIKDPRIIAVGQAFVKLHEDVVEGRYVYQDKNGDKRSKRAPQTAMFLDDGKFVYLKDRHDKNKLRKYNGLAQLDRAGISYNMAQRRTTEKTTADFIDRVSSESGYSKQALFGLYKIYQNDQIIKALYSNFLSQRERTIKILKKNNNMGVKSFSYFTAAGERSRRAGRTSIKDAINTFLSNPAYTRSTMSMLKGEIKDVSSVEDKAKFIGKFLTRIGEGGLFKSMSYAKNEDIESAFDNLEFMVNKSDLFETIAKKADNAVIEDSEVGVDLDPQDAKELMKKEDDEAKLLMLDDKISADLNSLITNLSRMINLDIKTERTASVKSAKGDKKYRFVLSGGSHKILNGIRKYLGSRKSYLPAFLNIKKNKYFANNIFRNGQNKIYEVEDFDGTLDHNGYNERVIEYKDEKFKSYLERSFSGQFVKSIANASRENPRYSQNLFTISNKPSNLSAVVKALDTKASKEALVTMVKQIQQQKDFDNIELGDKNRLVNLDVIALAIEEVMPGSVVPMQGEKENHDDIHYYKMNEGVMEKLAGKETVIAEAAYKILVSRAGEVIREMELGGVEIAISDLTHQKIQELTDKGIFKDVDIKKLKEQRIYDNDTNSIIYTGNQDRYGKIRETKRDVEARIKKFQKKHGQPVMASYSDMIDKLPGTPQSYLLKHHSLVEGKYLEPVVAAFIVNDYINSNHLTQLISGPQMFFKGANDLLKRLSGANAPGIRGHVDNILGMPETTNVIILDDVSFTAGNTMRETLTNVGLSKSEINKLENSFGGKEKAFEYSDGQGFMLPERYEEIVGGYGLAYNAGAVMKPAYYHIDANGVPRMLKYSSVVLTDELCDAHPNLKQLRDKMRFAGKDGSSIIGEVVFKSGNKVGIPKELASIDDIIRPNVEGEEKYFLDVEKQGFQIHNIDYRLQLNPVHSVYATVANPAQLSHFMNTSEVNIKHANSIYSSIAKIIRMGLADMKNQTDTPHGLANVIKSQLKKDERNRRNAELFDELMYGGKNNMKNGGGITSPWNFPSISETLSVQLSSLISKKTVQVRFKGAKLVLQTAFGTDSLEKSGELERKAAKLTYKTKPNVEKGKEEDVYDVMYAEALVPRGLLPKEMEAQIQEVVDWNSDPANSENQKTLPEQFVYPDLLGFRIPSSELHSAVPLKIVGFYASKENVNVIITPKEIVALHGSDYDVDALFVIKREYDKDGNLIGYKFDKTTERYVFDEEFYNSPEFEALDNKTKEIWHKNNVVDQFLQAISNQDNRYRMMQPISPVRIKREVARIMKLKSKKKKKSNDSSYILHRQKSHASSFEAVQGTGIFANALKVLAYMQRSSATNEAPTVIERASKDDSKIMTRRAISFNGILAKTLKNTEDLWNDLDALLNSAIDNVKEQDLPNLNLTSENIKAYVAMRAFGVGSKQALEVASNLFAQNFMEVRNKLGAQGDKQLSNGFRMILTAEEVSTEAMNKGTLNKNVLEQDVSSDLDLLEIFDKWEKTQDITDEERAFVKRQFVAYNEFSRAMDLGESFTNLSKLLSILKEQPAFKTDSDKIVEAYNKVFKRVKNKDGTFSVELNPNFGIDVSNLMNNLPHLKASYEVTEFMQKGIYERYFYRYNTKISKVVKQIHANNPIEYDGNKPEIQSQRMRDEFIKFVMNTVSWDANYGGFSREPKRMRGKRELYAENAFMDRMHGAVKALKKDPRTKSNLFVSSLSIENRGGKPFITFDSSGNLVYDDTIDYENTFDELLGYDIENDEVVDYTDRKYDMSLSSLQKDFMRYLVLQHGLVYAKSSYADVMPLRMMRIFHKAFESTMDNLIADEEVMKAYADLYAIQLAINHPDEKMRTIDPIDKVEVDKKAGNRKYVRSIPGKIYSDFEVSIVYKDNGKADWTATYKKFPPLVRSKGGNKRGNGTENTAIYRRLLADEQVDNVVRYQKVGNSTGNSTYSSPRNDADVLYDVNDAFRSDIRNIPQISINLTTIEGGGRVLEIGQTVSVTSYDDPARQNKKFYTVFAINTTGKGNRKMYSYDVKPARDIPDAPRHDRIVSSSGKKAQDTRPVIYEEINPDKVTVLDSAIELRSIADRGGDLGTIAESLIRKADDLAGKIFARPGKHFGQMDLMVGDKTTFYTTIDINERKIKNQIAKGKHARMRDEVILHEEIHRYTTPLFRVYDIANKEGKPLLDVLSAEEITFVDRIYALYEEYQKHPVISSHGKRRVNSVDQFIAYGLTDPVFIEHLKTLRFKKGKTSILNQIIKALGNLLAIDANIYESMLNEFLEFARMAEEGLVSRQLESPSPTAWLELVQEFNAKPLKERIPSQDRTEEDDQRDTLFCIGK